MFEILSENHPAIKHGPASNASFGPANVIDINKIV